MVGYSMGEVRDRVAQPPSLLTASTVEPLSQLLSQTNDLLEKAIELLDGISGQGQSRADPQNTPTATGLAMANRTIASEIVTRLDVLSERIGAIL